MGIVISCSFTFEFFQTILPLSPPPSLSPSFSPFPLSPPSLSLPLPPSLSPSLPLSLPLPLSPPPSPPPSLSPLPLSPPPSPPSLPLSPPPSSLYYSTLACGIEYCVTCNATDHCKSCLYGSELYKEENECVTGKSTS